MLLCCNLFTNFNYTVHKVNTDFQESYWNIPVFITIKPTRLIKYFIFSSTIISSVIRGDSCTVCETPAGSSAAL